MSREGRTIRAAKETRLGRPAGQSGGVGYVLLSQRKMLSMAGQLVAVRENGVTTQVYVDHLGSTAALGNGSGNFVAGSRPAYTPFGDWP